MSETTRQRLLREAVRRLGVDRVSKRLRASPEVLDWWLRGLARMPDRKLLPLADLLDEVADKYLTPSATTDDESDSLRHCYPRS